MKYSSPVANGAPIAAPLSLKSYRIDKNEERAIACGVACIKHMIDTLGKNPNVSELDVAEVRECLDSLSRMHDKLKDTPSARTDMSYN